MPPRAPLRLYYAPRPLRHSIHPQAFQLQCRRFRSDEVAKDQKPDLEPMRRAEQPPAPPPPIAAQEDPNLLLMRIQQAQRDAQRKKFETPTHSGHVKNGEEEKSFHPALAGFLGGLMIAFGVSYILYHISGSYHVQKASQKLNKELLEEQKRIVMAGNPSQTDGAEFTAEEITGWLRRASQYYSTFNPNSEKFVEAREKEIEKGLAQGTDKAKEVGSIAKDCAEELEKEVAPRNAAQNVMSGLMTGRVGWLIIMKHLLRIEEAVEGKEFVEKRRQRVAKGIIDE